MKCIVLLVVAALTATACNPCERLSFFHVFSGAPNESCDDVTTCTAPEHCLSCGACAAEDDCGTLAGTCSENEPCPLGQTCNASCGCVVGE